MEEEEIPQTSHLWRVLPVEFHDPSRGFLSKLFLSNPTSTDKLLLLCALDSRSFFSIAVSNPAPPFSTTIVDNYFSTRPRSSRATILPWIKEQVRQIKDVYSFHFFLSSSSSTDHYFCSERGGCIGMTLPMRRTRDASSWNQSL